MATQRIEGYADMTPTQRMLAISGRVFEATDVNGRTIKFRSLKAIERMRLKRMAGNDASNDAFMEDVYAAAGTVDIGGEPVAFPNSVRECEAIITRLDDVGLMAIAEETGRMIADDPQPFASQDEAAAATVADAKN